MTRIQRQNELTRWESVLRVPGIVWLVLVSAGAFAAHADVIAPVSVVTSSEWSGSPAPAGRLGNLIDGSGLSGVGPVESQTHEFHPTAHSMWHAGQQDGGLGGPTGAPPPVNSQVLVFDLGTSTDLAGAYIWNHNQTGLTARGVDGFQILVSSDSNPLTALYAAVGSYNLNEAMGTPAESAQQISFSAPGIRLVRFEISTTHSALANDWVGLSEVRFIETNTYTVDTKVGTWSTNPGSGHASSGTDLQRGGKFVVEAGYDVAVTPVGAESFDGFSFFSVDLAAGAAPPNGAGLIPNGNTLDVLIPFEGFDAGSPFIYAQTEFDHGDYPGDPFPSAVPQIHFNDAAASDFLGFKFESFDFGPGGNFVQLTTEVASQAGVPTPTTVVDILTSSFQTVIRSINSLADTRAVEAEAGPPLAYSIGLLVVPTDGGSFANPDGSWQDNDLGAARSDKEDFLTHTWQNLGSVESGATLVSLLGTDLDALRPDVIVSLPPVGTRAVENVNKSVALTDSGLLTTTDVATWQVAVEEDLTGLGSTDVVEVSYANTDPTVFIDATAQVGGYLFNHVRSDLDLAIPIANFELLSLAILVDGSPTSAFDPLAQNGNQTMTDSEILSLFGAGPHTLEFRLADRTLTSQALFVSDTAIFVPEPGPFASLIAGVLALGVMRRLRGRRE